MAASQPHPPDDFEASFETLAGRGSKFTDAFYARLFERHPELETKFAGVLLAHQGAMLMSALGIVAATTQRRQMAADAYLKVLGHRHYQRDIAVEDYEKFKTVLLETMADQLGDAWNAPLESAWHTALDHAIETMGKGHREGPVVY